MKNMASSLPALIALTLLLLSIFNPSMLVQAEENGSSNNSFAHDTCNRFQYEQLYKVCIPEIDSDPREDLKSNLTGLLIIFVNRSISNFKDNIEFLQRELKSVKLDGKTKEMFDTCLENFETGISALQEGMHILLTETGIDVYLLPTSSIFNRISDCAEDFEGDPVPPEWHSRYNTSLNLTNLILGVTNLVKCNREFACIP